MTDTPTILVLEPANKQRQRQAVGILVRKEPQFDLGPLRIQLKAIRQHAGELCLLDLGLGR